MYVERDENGKIRGVYALEQETATEFIADNSPELEAFQNSTPNLPARLLAFLNEKSQEISAAIESGVTPPPPGTFTGIAQLSGALQELARLVPVSIYAPEAYAAVTNLGTLPEPLETVRLSVLTMISDELNS